MFAVALVIALIPAFQIVMEDMKAGYELVPAEVM
jgi:hypothetical protein